METPHPLLALAFKNDYISSQYPHPDNAQGAQAAGERYLDQIFPNWKLPQTQELLSQFPRNEDERQKHAIVSKLVNEFDLGMLLVRPEMLHHSGSVLDFLVKQKFSIRYASHRIVRKQAYAVMYNEVFRKPQALPSFPTRTIVYLDSPSMLVLFTDPLHRFAEQRLADGFCSEYKGREGIFDHTTVRGSVIYPEAIRLGFHTLINETLQIALDPLTALRWIVKATTPNLPHSHLPQDEALLKYNAVSVHVPDSTEIVRDLCVINNLDELGEISYALSR